MHILWSVVNTKMLKKQRKINSQSLEDVLAGYNKQKNTLAFQDVWSLIIHLASNQRCVKYEQVNGGYISVDGGYILVDSAYISVNDGYIPDGGGFIVWGRF